ncbi:MAG TPA: SpoIIE family protein phosphatase [Solirubrobacteraceae bacterium]|nr:SpoIIE family protein phosphatase [Solirubrobacteraceae bacterium]
MAGGAIVTPVAERAVTREPIGVLLVEDDEGDARLVEDELAERLPLAKIARSRSLKDALTALGPEIDCVLLDLGLPDTSGLDAVAQLRARGPGTPLIVLTGLDDQAAGVAAVEAGAQDYLVKGRVDGEQLARSIHYAIGRRRAEEAERELLLAEAQAREVGRLEKGLAPSLSVEDPAIWVASCYRAGRSRALLGGDFFDLVQTEDGLLHALVGDVCGHGPDEAAIGVSLRVAWRALALAGNEPQVTLRTMQRVFEHERHVQGLFATLCTIEIDPRGDDATVIRAGHPAPMLIDGSSTAALCQAIGDGAVGINRGSWAPERVTLPQGWTILLYTDGIIEGRVDGGVQRLGEEAFRRLVAERIASRPDWRERPAALLDELIAEAERLNGGALSDDVAMLLVGARERSDGAGPAR